MLDLQLQDTGRTALTTHPPSCDCDACFVDDLNAVLRRFVEEREIREHNAAALHLATEQSAWGDTVKEGGR